MFLIGKFKSDSFAGNWKVVSKWCNVESAFIHGFPYYQNERNGALDHVIEDCQSINTPGIDAWIRLPIDVETSFGVWESACS